MAGSRHLRSLGLAVAVGGVPAVLTGALLVSTASVGTAGAKTFEADDEGMTSWYDATLARVTSPAPHEGAYSLRVQPGTSHWGVEEEMPGEFAVAPGRSYRVDLWARAVSGTTSVNMTVVWVGADDRQVGQDTVAAVTALPTVWTERSGTLTAPSGAATAAFRFTGTGLGSWQLDDVTVQPASPAPSSPPPSTTAGPSTTSTAPPTSTAKPKPKPPARKTTARPPVKADVPPAAPCADPAFVTSADDGWGDGDYYVHNNLWNASGFDVSQTLAACSHRSWSVTATADDRAHDGAVKTYPNVHKDYHDWDTDKEPALSSYPSIRSTFAATSPHVGVYNVAYDIWLNGVPGNREVMIWTDNYRQVPAGSRVATGLSFAGRTWSLYATGDNEYLAFVPSQPMTRGSLDITAFLNYLVAKGRVPASSTLGQICFGVEIVSTDGKPATFRFTDFSVTD